MPTGAPAWAGPFRSAGVPPVPCWARLRNLPAQQRRANACGAKPRERPRGWAWSAGVPPARSPRTLALTQIDLEAVLLDLNLRGRVAIVTGGSQGIGYATAESCWEGVAVSICARDEERLANARKQLTEETGGRVEAMHADVSDGEQIENFVHEAERRVGPVDILVNNAANYRDGDMWEMPDENWEHHIANKFMGYARFVRLVVPGMKERGWGRIINLGGGASRHVILGSGTAGPVNAAIANYTKYIATELAPHGIRVNLVNPAAPGPSGAKSQSSAGLQEKGLSREAVIENIIRNVPIGRMIEASDAAKLITFLASDCAEAIVGQAISCDGERIEEWICSESGCSAPNRWPRRPSDRRGSPPRAWPHSGADSGCWLRDVRPRPVGPQWTDKSAASGDRSRDRWNGRQVGDKAVHFKPGDCVASKQFTMCGWCDNCRSGREMECPNRHFNYGGYAEYVALEERALASVPPEVDLADASVVACALGSCYHALVDIAELLPGESVVVTGAGGGLGPRTPARQDARRPHNCDHDVAAKNRRAARLRGRRGGRSGGCRLLAADPGGELRPAGRSRARQRWPPLAVHALLPRPGPPRPLRLHRPGGAHQGRFYPAFVFGKEAIITGAGSTRMGEFLDFLELVRDGRVRPIIERFLLDDVATAWERMDNREVVGRAVLIP